MIYSKELRIGNYVNSNYDFDCVWEVTEISTKYIKCIPEDINKIGFSCDNPDEFNPIELTAEWLEKLGFEKQLYSEDLFLNKRSQVCKIKDKWVYRVPGYTLCNVNYIHQLQNLTYFITGQELTLKS